mmetsp:Transcript_45466/g.110127  ORF Transcript_45466/g.110127 Transcript_45466/m.110127 type:complete len:867 (+) Transcript_45466:123-2723(+)
MKRSPQRPHHRGAGGDEDENDDGEWSDTCLYRRMLRGSQRIRMMKRQNNHSSEGSSSLPLLQQALQNAEVEPACLQGIKVLRINIHKAKTFDMRYFTIDKTREYICLTPEPLPPNVLAQGNCHKHYISKQKQQQQQSQLQHKFAFAGTSASNNNNNTPTHQFIDVADIDAWHVGTVATRRAEVARRLETTRAKGGSSFDQVATEKLLTIYYKGKETLDLVVPVSQQLNMIVSSLAEIHSTFHRAQPWISKESSLLRYIIANQMVEMMDSSSAQDKITQAQFHKICEILNVGEANGDPAFCFQSRTNKDELPFSECMSMLQSLKPKKTQAMVLWDFLFGDAGRSISHKDLHGQFLSQIQSESHLSIRQAQALLTFIQTIEVWNPLDGSGNPQDHDNNSTSRKTTLQKDQFEEFLFSDLNDAYDPEIQQMEQRLDQPLSAYWINTAFKTYRTRISGSGSSSTCASVEGYMKALIRGCKCLDLDCWDGPAMPNANICIPMVMGAGGGVKTDGNSGNLLLRHVLDVVEAYLKMHPQSYPIILSIENYCTPPFQEAMALLLQEILGHRLAVPPQTTNNSNNNWWDASLPSPEALRGRVILHSKAFPELTNDMNSNNNIDWLFHKFGMKNKAEHEMEEIVGSLSQLVFFEGGKLTGNLNNNNNGDTPRHKILSVAAGSKQKEMLRAAAGGIEENDHRLFHASHLTRSHPTSVDDKKSTRKNHNPVQAWSLGYQAVALRLDHCCAADGNDNAAVLLNDGLFRQQNGVGYVLKSPFILGLEPANPISLFVRVLGGRCLPSPKNTSSSRRGGGDQSSYLSVSVTLYDVQTTTTTKKNNNDTTTTTTTTDKQQRRRWSRLWRAQEFSRDAPTVHMI